MSTVTVNTQVKRRKAKVKARRRVRIPAAVSACATTFTIVLGMTYLVSSLSGQVMAEKARQDAIRASEKALDARKIEAELSKRLDEMTGFNAIDQWAQTHNFKSISELAAAAAPTAVVPKIGSTPKLAAVPVSAREGGHAKG